jgi:alkylation response protein AidB-like acyl-CoA dehydrogenase
VKLSLDDEQTMLKDSVARFVTDNFDVDQRRRLRDAGEAVDPKAWQQMADLGWLGLPFAEKDGGLGGSHVETMVLMEELGRGLVSLPYLSTVLICGGLLSRCSESTRSAYLPALIAGESHWAFAFAEQSGRYQLDSVATVARAVGSAYQLGGEKVAVINGAGADHLLVTAAIAGSDKVGLFLVAQPSLCKRRPVALIDGTPGAAIEFDACPAQLLAEDGLAVVGPVLDEVILAMAAQGLGSMEALLELTVDYTKTREQFGQPIGKFQVLQHRMADMYMQTQSLRSLLYRGVLAHQDQAPDRARSSSALKVKLGEAGRYVAQQAVQLHGGMGMSDELAVGHYLKSLLLLNVLFGDAEHHLDRFLSLQA